MKHYLFLAMPLLLSCSVSPNSESEAPNESSSETLSSVSSIVSSEKEVDVFVFMGQSNMAGRGDREKSIVCGKGHGYEYCSVSDPGTLHDIEEPFGVNENNLGINDGNKKTGSLVSSFVESYYQITGVPIVGISASQGGTSSSQWQPGGGKLEEAENRLSSCLDYLYSLDELSIRHIEMVWLQGENDAGNEVPYETYKNNLQNIVDGMKGKGVEHCFSIQIGPYMASESEQKHALYETFHAYQVQMAGEMEDVDLCSIKLSGVPESMMHDKNHFYQEAYNIVGTDAGKNVAAYMLEGTMPELTPYSEADNAINQL